MSRHLPPCKQRDFIRRLRDLGFEGPLAGGNHRYMVYGARRLPIPSYGEYTPPMLSDLLNQVERLVGPASMKRECFGLRPPARQEVAVQAPKAVSVRNVSPTRSARCSASFVSGSSRSRPVISRMRRRR